MTAKENINVHRQCSDADIAAAFLAPCSRDASGDVVVVACAALAAQLHLLLRTAKGSNSLAMLN